LLPPLRVAALNLWRPSAAPILNELQILHRLLYAASGRLLHPIDGALPLEEQLEMADVILMGPYGDPKRAKDVAARQANRTLTVFLGSENTHTVRRRAGTGPRKI